MLDVGLLDRYFLELPKDITAPVKVPQMPKLPRNPETLVERVKPIKKQEPAKQEKDSEALKKAKQEISDAVAELVAELEIEKKQELPVFFDEKRAMYALIDFEHKVMDYSKLEYGKIAEPLSVERGYQSYDTTDGKTASSQETISIKEVNEIITEKAFLDLNNASTKFIRHEIDERFKYWKLFNDALKIIKYHIAFQ